MANQAIFNIFTGTLDYVGGGQDLNFLDPVATESLLPTPALDGAICVVQATKQVYEYSVSLGQWSNVTQKFIDTIGAASANGIVSSSVTNGNNVVETHLALTPADATHPGVVTTGTQTIAGVKTFSSNVLSPGFDSVSSGGTVGIGYTNATTINIGHSGSTVNILGTTNNINVTNYNVANKVMNMNTAGPAGSASGVGLDVQENSIVTAYFLTSSDRNSWQMLAPNTAGIITFTPGASGFTINQGSHNPLSLSTPGLGISLDAANQILSAQYASSGQPGLVSASAQTFSGDKSFAGSILSSGTIDTSFATQLNIGTTTTTGIHVGSSGINFLTPSNAFFTNSNTPAYGAAFMNTNQQLTSAVLSNGQLLIGATGSTPTPANITGTNGQVIVTNGASSITLSLPQSISTSSTPQFNSLLLTSSSNQLALGSSTNLLTLNSGSSIAARTYTVPDVGTSANFVMDQGAQTIAGVKSFTSNINVPNLFSSSVLVTDASHNITASSVSTTTLSYLDATSSVQNQLNNKLSLTGGSMTGPISMQSNYIHTVADPLLAQDAATKHYVDALASLVYVTGDLGATTFLGSNNQSTAANVTGASFNGTVTRTFQMQLGVMVNATTSLSENFSIDGAYDGTDWIYSYSSVGDSTGVVFSMTTAGQLQYQSPSYGGFTSLKMVFRASTTGV